MDARIDFATADDQEPMTDLLELFTLESDFTPERQKQLAGLHLILDNPAVGQLFVLHVDDGVAGIANAQRRWRSTNDRALGLRRCGCCARR